MNPLTEQQFIMQVIQCLMHSEGVDGKYVYPSDSVLCVFDCERMMLNIESVLTGEILLTCGYLPEPDNMEFFSYGYNNPIRQHEFTLKG